MHKYSHHVEKSLSECVVTIHRQTSLRPFFCIPLAEFVSTDRFTRSSFSRSPNFFSFLASSLFAGYDRQTHQNISLVKIRKMSLFLIFVISVLAY